MARRPALLKIGKVLLFALMVAFLIEVFMTFSEWITDLKWFYGLERVCSFDRMNLRSLVTYEERQKMILKNDTKLKRVLPGGSYRPYLPPDCDQSANIAVIVAYRNRVEHLKIFVPYMHSFLQKQGLPYTLFIIEQSNTSQFNRGLLLNVGFQIASSRQNFSCYVFHDVDLLPENEQNLYACHQEVRHMSSANSKYGNSLPYREYFGGVVSFNKEQFRKINGFSNVYFGWGQEDDDLRLRVISSGLSYVHPPKPLGRYVSLPHVLMALDLRKIVPRADIKSTILKRMTSDGLNSLRYQLLYLKLRDLYTWVYIAVDEDDIMQRYKVCTEQGWPCKM